MFSRCGEEETLKMIKNAGFEGVDYSFHELDERGEWNAINLDDHVNKAKTVKSLLEKYGLVCNQAHAPFCFKYGDKIGGKKFNDIVSSMEFAAVLGAKVIVVHAIKVPPLVSFTDYNLNFYKALEPYAVKFGVKIAIENLVNSIFWNPNRLCAFINLLDSPVFCACIDVGHAELQGIQPQKFIAGMDKGVLECLHIQDLDGKSDKHWIPYHGELDWDEIFKALIKYGFDGDLNFEIVRPWDERLPKELLPASLTYAGEIGKYMLDRYEQLKKN